MAVLAVFTYSGSRRGAIRELLLMLGTIAGILVNTRWGNTLWEVINQQAMQGPLGHELVKAEMVPTATFALFVVIVAVSYIAGQLIPIGGGGLGGGLFGMVNGYLILSQIVPLLPPKLPVPLLEEAQTVATASTGATTLLSELKQMQQQLGLDPALIILGFVAVTILWIATRLR